MATEYLYAAGACYGQKMRLLPNGWFAQMFIDFHTMVVRDGVQPWMAHKAFLNFEEYRDAIAPDIPESDPIWKQIAAVMSNVKAVKETQIDRGKQKAELHRLANALLGQYNKQAH